MRSSVAAVLGYADVGQVDVGRVFREQSMDSLTALRPRNQLSAATGLRLPATLVFDHPTPAGLTAYFAEQLAPEPAEPRWPSRAGRAGQVGRRSGGGAGRAPRRGRRRLRDMLDGLTGGGRPRLSFETADAADLFAFIDNDLGRAG